MKTALESSYDNAFYTAVVGRVMVSRARYFRTWTCDLLFFLCVARECRRQLKSSVLCRCGWVSLYWSGPAAALWGLPWPEPQVLLTRALFLGKKKGHNAVSLKRHTFLRKLTWSNLNFSRLSIRHDLHKQLKGLWTNVTQDWDSDRQKIKKVGLKS